MGWFKKKETRSELLIWLEKADAAYAQSYQLKDIKPLQSYVERTCALNIMQSIRSSEKAYSGLERYKHVNWSKSSETSDVAVYTKVVKYDHVKLSHGVVAPVGVDYTEEWVIALQPALKVREIRRLSA